ncbi:MAG: hypothetical protein AAFQ36_01030 [Pseudomonadota bacterium]
MKFLLPLAVLALLVACGSPDERMKPDDIAEDTDIDGAWFSSDFEAEGPKIFVRRTDGVIEYFMTAERDGDTLYYSVGADMVLTGSAGLGDGRVGDTGPRIPLRIISADETCDPNCATRATVQIDLTEAQFEAGQTEGLLVFFYGNKDVSFRVQREYVQGFAMALDAES